MKYQNRAVLLIYPIPISTWEKNPHHLPLSNLILRYLIQEYFLLIIVELLREAQLSSRVHRNTLWAILALAAANHSRESDVTAAHTSKVSKIRTSWQSRSILLRVGKKIKSIYRVWDWRGQKLMPKSSTGLGAGELLVKTMAHTMLRITGQDLLQVTSIYNKKKMLPVSPVLTKRKALHYISLLNPYLTDYSTTSYSFTLYTSFWPDSPQHFRAAQKKAKTKAKREKKEVIYHSFTQMVAKLLCEIQGWGNPVKQSTYPAKLFLNTNTLHTRHDLFIQGHLKFTRQALL